MTQQDKLLKAKIPCAETGIEIKKSICDICAPNSHCGVSCYVKDGRIIKIEGDENHPVSKGFLCTKGLSNRAYIYKNSRVLTPLRRVGARGNGHFEPISWEEAYKEIAAKLLEIKDKDGPESVAFFSGYSKWYRPILQRLAYSFGSPNYGTESSCCFTSGLMAWQVATGYPAETDMTNSDLLLGWALNGYYSRYLLPRRILEQKKRGMKVIIVDPRITPATKKLADIHLRPRPGTDGALALTIANVLIRNGWIDREYIKKYVHGFDEFSEYARGFDQKNVEDLTGVPYSQVFRAAEMISRCSSMCINESSAPLGHHRNGMQNYRAIMSLLAITGNYDVAGGQRPSEHTYTHVSAGFSTGEEEFARCNEPVNARSAVGEGRFPLWYHLGRQMQSNDLSRQILEETPYSIKAAYALGMNFRMFPESDKMLEALKKLDFFVDTDLFLTDTARYADIVLPACSSFERGEFKAYSGGYVYYTKPVIAPLGESKPDVDILCELAEVMKLDDPLLRGGYTKCVDDILRNNCFSREGLLEHGRPILAPEFEPFRPGGHVSVGLRTPTGKFELKSEIIAAHPEWRLDALPTYAPPLSLDEEQFPMVLSTGVRIPNAIHSRLHDVEWPRSIRPMPLAEISLEDAAELGICEGTRIRVVSERGHIELNAAPTATVRKGEVFLFHGYPEADANLLISSNDLDPYSGFPPFRSSRCRVERIG